MFEVIVCGTYVTMGQLKNRVGDYKMVSGEATAGQKCYEQPLHSLERCIFRIPLLNMFLMMLLSNGKVVQSCRLFRETWR